MKKILQLRKPSLLGIATTILVTVAGPALTRQLSATDELPIGLHLFLSTGCGACHRIAGTQAQGKIGPDLTHLASRDTLGANLMPMNAENLADWITRTQELKPGARMPSFSMLPPSETKAIVDYLVTLE